VEGVEKNIYTVDYSSNGDKKTAIYSNYVAMKTPMLSGASSQMRPGTMSPAARHIALSTMQRPTHGILSGSAIPN
jgi:hypothetical protein